MFGGGSASQQQPSFNQQTASLQPVPYSGGSQQSTIDPLQPTPPPASVHSVTTMDNSFPPQQQTYNTTFTPTVMQVQQPPGKTIITG